LFQLSFVLANLLTLLTAGLSLRVDFVNLWYVLVSLSGLHVQFDRWWWNQCQYNDCIHI